MTSFLLGPIIGGLSHDRANLWARASGPATLHAWIGSESDLSDARLVGTTPLGALSGYAGMVTADGLESDNRYYYALTKTEHTPDPAQGPYSSFRTAPDKDSPIAFAFGSCFCPGDEHGGRIFKSLSERIKPDDLRFVLMLGDQIYADKPHCHKINKIATTLKDYRAVYEYAWSRPNFQALLAELPTFMILDDHEVDDDWAWLDADRERAQIPWRNRFWRWLVGRSLPERTLPRVRVQNALQAYWEHQGMHAPPPLRIPQPNVSGQFRMDSDDSGSLAYKFDFGDAAFFVLDTRTRRVRSRKEHQMLGENQWAAFEAWLQHVKDRKTFKFVVTSSSMLGDFIVDLARDRWSGFPIEQRRMLSLIALYGVEGVIFLVGDLHSGHAIRVDMYGPDGRTIPVWEFCSSPFEQDVNFLARWPWLLRHTTQGPVRCGEVYWTAAEHNFGVVKVTHGVDRAPDVRFVLFGTAGKEIRSVSTSDP